MSKNKNEEVYKIGINWYPGHIYAKLSLNPYKIRKLKNWVFTYFYKNEESFNNFIIGKKLKYGL